MRIFFDCEALFSIVIFTLHLSCNTSQALCSVSRQFQPDAAHMASSEAGTAPDNGHHHRAFRRVICAYCAAPANANAALPPLPRSALVDCQEQLSDIGVFVHAGTGTMSEASRAALAAATSLPSANVIISTDVADESIAGDYKSAADAGIRVMPMPDDDDGAHSGGYGADAPWKKAQSRFPHALAAAVRHLPRNVKWIISQDSDTALNIPAIAAVLASQDPGSKVIFGCIYEHVRQSLRKAHHGGGAGMIFSRAAAQSIVEAWQAHLPYSAPRCLCSTKPCFFETVLKFCAGARASTCGLPAQRKYAASSCST